MDLEVELEVTKSRKEKKQKKVNPVIMYCKLISTF